MPQRIDFYGNYHKAIRRALFELSARAGLLDYAHDHDGLARLIVEFECLARALREHGTHEDAYMHPLLRKYAPEVLESMERQHGTLDPALDVLEQQLRAVASPADGMQFYAALNRFIGAYLEHLADEEEVANPVLWERCPHDEMQEAVTRFRASFALEQVASSFEFMLPALNGAERADLYKSVRDNAPQSVFDTLLGVAQKTLAAADYDDLRQRLALC
jgi:hemerythrin-like domain-containing protein